MLLSQLFIFELESIDALAHVIEQLLLGLDLGGDLRIIALGSFSVPLQALVRRHRCTLLLLLHPFEHALAFGHLLADLFVGFGTTDTGVLKLLLEVLNARPQTSCFVLVVSLDLPD